MISSNDLRRGSAIKVDGTVFVCVESQHVKPGKGGAFVRTKLRHFEKNTVIEKTFRAGEKLEPVYIDKRPVQYSYFDGENYVFMDTENYEQIEFPKDQIGEARQYLLEGMDLEIECIDEHPVNPVLPIFMEYQLAECEPGLKGDTVSGATKRAVCQNGLVVQVPLFLKETDTIKVDTRSGEYIERVTG